jgi:hypothetical protein
MDPAPYGMPTAKSKIHRAHKQVGGYMYSLGTIHTAVHIIRIPKGRGLER